MKILLRPHRAEFILKLFIGFFALLRITRGEGHFLSLSGRGQGEVLLKRNNGVLPKFIYFVSLIQGLSFICV
jgi:hypothetical protein